MDNFKIYSIPLIKEKYPIDFACILERIEYNFKTISINTEFAKTSKNPLDKRLDICSYFLVFIKTLNEKNESFENIRTMSLQIANEYVKPKNKLQALLKKLLPQLINTWFGQILINSLQKKKKTSLNANADGFKAQIITNTEETFGLGFGFDVIECGICKLFNKHNYSHYASILCEIDEVTSRLAGLQLIRKGTIANGIKKCDFRFKFEEK